MRFALVLLLSLLSIGPAYAEPLKGTIEQNAMPGGLQQTDLNGGAQGWGMPINQQQGTMGQWPQGPLQGSASGNNPMQANIASDPDFGNQELVIAWDQWRNRLMQAIQTNTLAKINVHDNVHFVWDPRTQMMQSRYPNGTMAWYSFGVLPNRQIINLRITLSSRYPSYDQAVMQAISDLQGNWILQYPAGSRRQIVTQEANVGTAPQSSTQTFQFNDFERQQR